MTADGDFRIDAESLARLQRQARHLQAAAVAAWIARLFGRDSDTRVTDGDADGAGGGAVEGNGDAEVLRRLRASAARLLGSRAVHGPVSDYLLADIGLTRKDVEGVRVPDLRSYRVDAGSTAA